MLIVVIFLTTSSNKAKVDQSVALTDEQTETSTDTVADSTNSESTTTGTGVKKDSANVTTGSGIVAGASVVAKPDTSAANQKTAGSPANQTATIYPQGAPAAGTGSSGGGSTGGGGSAPTINNTPASTANNSSLYDVSKVSTTDRQRVQEYLNSHLNSPSIANLQVGKNGMAFAFIYYKQTKEATSETIQEVVFVNTNDPSGPTKLFVANNYSEQLGFGVAISPSGEEIIIAEHDGTIKSLETATGKISVVGNYPYHYEEWDAGDIEQTYAYPAYTLDGKHIIFHNVWTNQMAIVDATTKDFSKAKILNKYWITPPADLNNYNLYTFSADNKSATFSGKKIDLTTL